MHYSVTPNPYDDHKRFAILIDSLKAYGSIKDRAEFSKITGLSNADIWKLIKGTHGNYRFTEEYVNIICNQTYPKGINVNAIWLCSGLGDMWSSYGVLGEFFDYDGIHKYYHEFKFDHNGVPKCYHEFITNRERIERLIKYLKIPAADLSKEIGLSSPRIFYDIKVGKCDIPQDVVTKIQLRYPEINAEWLLYGNG